MFIQFVIILLFTVIWGFQWSELPAEQFQLAVFCVLLGILVFAWRMSNSKPLSARILEQNRQWLCWGLNSVSAFIIGLIMVFSQAFFINLIPDNYYDRAVLVSGKLVEPVKHQKSGSRHKLQFTVKTDAIKAISDKPVNQNARLNYQFIQPKLQLNWYLSDKQLSVLQSLPKLGESWQFVAKLKQNHGAMNLGALDYEAWLLQQGISAKGYISGVQYNKNGLALASAKKLGSQSIFAADSWRYRISELISKSAENPSLAAIYQALLVGNKSLISDEQWQVFRQTGTTHLMAISGLHMGIMAMLGYLLFRGLWWVYLYRFESLNRPVLAASGALLLASLYLLVSGASIPTQRAWLMVMALLIFVFFRRHFNPWRALALAALMIVIWHPMSLLTVGFWLSFVAVAIIFISLQVFKQAGYFKKLIAVQWFLTWGLAPLVVFYFGQLPLLSWLANLLVVPVVSLLGLPLLLGTTLMSAVNEFMSSYLWQISDFIWQGIWLYLQQLQQWSLTHHLVLQYPQVSIGWLLMAMALFFGLLIMAETQAQTDVVVLDSGREDISATTEEQNTFVNAAQSRLKILARPLQRNSLLLLPVVMLLILIWPLVSQNQTIKAGMEAPFAKPMDAFSGEAEAAHFEMTIIDVGQGLSVVVATQRHLVVYDSGARWGTTDAANIAILPYLKFKQWPQIDKLIISHSDNDHAGGIPSLVNAIPVKQLVSGQVEKMPVSIMNNGHTPVWQACVAGQSWLLDGVRFEFISPTRAMLKTSLSDNDSSCVLKVSNSQSSALLMGDASVKVERRIMQHFDTDVEKLNADLLVAGHHGSKYSTSADWLDAVKPEHIVFSSGYKNRYQFPAKETLKRIQDYSEKRRQTQTDQYDIAHNQTGSNSSAKLGDKEPPHERQVKWWNTACSGALSFVFDEQIKLGYQARKKLMKWYHHRCNATQQGIFYQ
nr:DNA internalization-related competence protein ComEC/Rec2 [Thiomicrorhabdus sediminis]